MLRTSCYSSMLPKGGPGPHLLYAPGSSQRQQTHVLCWLPICLVDPCTRTRLLAGCMAGLSPSLPSPKQVAMHPSLCRRLQGMQQTLSQLQQPAAAAGTANGQPHSQKAFPSAEALGATALLLAAAAGALSTSL